MADNKLYSKIEVEFASLMDDGHGGQKDPNDVSAAQWQQGVANAVKSFITEHVKVVCSFEGSSSSGPDSVTADTWDVTISDLSFTVPSDYLNWCQILQTQLTLGMKIQGAGQIGVVLNAPMQPIVTGTLVISQNILQSKNTLKERWDFVGDVILSWIETHPSGVGGSATHNIYSGPTLQISNLIV